MTSVTKSLPWVTVLSMAASGTMNETEAGVLNGILDKEDLKTLPDLVNQAFMNASESNNFQMASEILNKRKKYLSCGALLKAHQSFKEKENESLRQEIFSNLSKFGVGGIEHHPGSIQVQTWPKK